MTRGRRSGRLAIGCVAAVEAVVLVACHRATPADVGAASARAAMPIATMRAGARAQAASPVVVSPSAGGAALQQPSGPL